MDTADGWPHRGFGDVGNLTAVLRRVVASRVADRDVIDEIVQETLVRLLSAHRRLDEAAIAPYAIVTARNLVATRWRKSATGRRHEHRLLDPAPASQPEDELLLREEESAIRAALGRLGAHEQALLVAHEVDGAHVQALADDVGSTPGAIAARLNRSRAKLRVEYLLEMHGEPPTSRCRPILFALSAGDTRRQAALDGGAHLLECEFCAVLSEPLFDRRSEPDVTPTSTEIRVDADIVVARQRGRDVALEVGFSTTEATVIATAISEIARNIVRFTRGGRIVTTAVVQDGVPGIMVVATDNGPGIDDIDLALTVGYTTYGGRGLGLPGSRALMDDFDITSDVDEGTTVTMTKWHRT